MGSSQEREGWLSKKGKRGWRRRYFVAKADGSLVWTREPLHRHMDREKQAREQHAANLRSAVAVRDLPNSAKHYVFTLAHGSADELVLAADSAREKKEWMEALASWIPNLH